MSTNTHNLDERIESLEAALAVATGYVLALANDEVWEAYQEDMKKWVIDVPKVKEIAAQYGGEAK